jgi:hypothetical protein
MRGILSYIAIVSLISIWMLGWLGLTVLVGAFFDLPGKTTSITGAVLGPLGFVMVIFVGIAQSKGRSGSSTSSNRSIPRNVSHVDTSDPFI